MNEYLLQLWNRVLEGDNIAWSELVKRYSALVFTVATRIGLSNIDAEDCAQYTWVTLYKKRHTIKDPIGLPAWLILTTKRRAMRILKTQHRQSDFPADLEYVESSIPPDKELLNLELQDILERAIEQLDPRCQKLLYSLFLSPKEYSYEDIARELGISRNTLGPLRSRCLKKLRTIVKKMGYPEY